MTFQTRTGESITNQTKASNKLGGGAGTFNNLNFALSTTNTQDNMEFLNFAEFMPLSTSLGYILKEITMNQTGGNETVSTFIIIFPGPFYQVIYDPNFGVVLTSDGTNQGRLLIFILQMVIDSLPFPNKEETEEVIWE